MIAKCQKASQPKPLSQVQQNLMPSDKAEALKLIKTRMEEDMFKFFHKQQLRPRPDTILTNINPNVSVAPKSPDEGILIKLQYMEYNGSWKMNGVIVFVEPGKFMDSPPGDFHVTDLAGYQNLFDKLGLGKEQLGEAAFLITDLDDNPIHPHLDSFRDAEVGAEYVLHVAPKHVCFILTDDEGNERQFLEVVKYGEPARQLCDRIRAGLGISEWAAMTMLRDGEPFYVEFKNFRFSKNPADIDVVTITTKKFCHQQVYYKEYPVARISPLAIVRFSVAPSSPISSPTALRHLVHFFC